MSYAQLMRILWRHKFVAVPVAAIVMVVAGAVLLRQPPEYRSTATVALLPNGSDAQAVAFYGEISRSLVPTYAEVIKSRTFLDGVAPGLPFRRTGKALQGDIFVEPVPNAGILKVTARAGRPGEAFQIAAATVRAFQDAVADNSVVRSQVIDAAHVPDRPVSPNRKLALVASLALGVFVGGGGALGWERLFGRVRDPGGLAEASALSVLGVLSQERSLAAIPRVIAGDPTVPAFEESLRVLAANVVFEVEKARAGSVAITGLDSQDGASLVAANLAVVLGEMGVQVLVVDADARYPSQHHFFRLPNDEGLSSTALDGARTSALIRQTAYPGVGVLVAGPLLDSRKDVMDLYLQRVPRLSELAELVIVDAPPLREGADVRLLVSSVDAVILVVRAGSVGPAELRAAVEDLRVPDTRLLGTVLTRGPGPRYRMLRQPGYAEPPTPAGWRDTPAPPVAGGAASAEGVEDAGSRQ